jgi:hypothetical protein
MGKYGDTAVRAAGLLQNGCKSAETAWTEIAGEVFSNTREGRRKSCPKEAFLGLCQEGVIRGVSASTCTEPESSLNRGYAREAVRLLKADPSLAHGSKIALWRRVMSEVGADQTKEHNRQMEVVLALWNKRLISV